MGVEPGKGFKPDVILGEFREPFSNFEVDIFQEGDLFLVGQVVRIL